MRRSGLCAPRRKGVAHLTDIARQHESAPQRQRAPPALATLAYPLRHRQSLRDVAVERADGQLEIRGYLWRDSTSKAGWVRRYTEVKKDMLAFYKSADKGKVKNAISVKRISSIVVSSAQPLFGLVAFLAIQQASKKWTMPIHDWGRH